MAKEERIETEANHSPIKSQEVKNEDEEYDEDEDEDFDPTKKQDVDEEEDVSDNETKNIPDYSNIESTTTQVKTRSQRLFEKETRKSKFIGNYELDSNGLVKETSTADINSIFDELKNTTSMKEISISQEPEKNSTKDIEEVINEEDGPKKVKIQINYTFAGKLITESKDVDENSEEAKAYLNSTNSITSTENDLPFKRSQVEIIRPNPFNPEEKLNLRIKLKRPSLIDRFVSLNNNKKMKLSTLEKSRLDWASFIDKRKIGDELKKHNKSGYLDKQDFLMRSEYRKDELYKKAKDEEQRKKALQNM